MFIELLHLSCEVPYIEISDDPTWTTNFYKSYVSTNTPAIIRNGCKHWLATDKWNSKFFL